MVKLNEDMMGTNTPASFEVFKSVTNCCHFPQNAILLFIYYFGTGASAVSGTSTWAL